MQGEALLSPSPVSSPGTWRHLAVRFLSVVFSSGLTPDEIQEIRGWLSPAGPDADAFFAQAGYDQRHGLNAAKHVESLQPGRSDLIRAALLHDIGKRHAGLGVVGRSLASAHSKLGGRPKGKWRRYMEHGPAGAQELEALGVEQIVVDFARHHHEDRPASILPADWALLQAADGVSRKTGDGPGAGKPDGR